MRKFFKFKFIIPVFILLIAINIDIFYIKYIRTQNGPLLSSNNTVKIIVNEGDNLYSVFDRLYSEEELRSVFFSKLYIKQNKLNVDIKPGEYNVPVETNLHNLISLLTEGGETLKITFPEGITVEEIATKLEKNGLVKKSEFLDMIQKYPTPGYVKKDLKKKYFLEGFLFPDTYVFSKNQKPEEIIKLMLFRFEKAMKEAQQKTNIEVKEEDYEKYVNIASMIEKEAKLDKDRPLISSVIHNRLNKNMLIQIDATVIYPYGEHKEVVTLKDLEIQSPYNTYKNHGLPVGPISNPGILSLEAAINPAKTNYLYYILQKDNSHYFTNSYNDFLKKKKELGL